MKFPSLASLSRIRADDPGPPAAQVTIPGEYQALNGSNAGIVTIDWPPIVRAFELVMSQRASHLANPGVWTIQDYPLEDWVRLQVCRTAVWVPRSGQLEEPSYPRRT